MNLSFQKDDPFECVILFNMSSPMNATLLLLLCHCYALTTLEGPSSRSERHSRYAKLCYKSLPKHQRLLRRKYIPQPSLHFPNVLSVWCQMYDAWQDHSIITLTGLNFATFNWFAVLFDTHSHSMEPDNWRHCHSTTSYTTRQQETFHHCR